MVGHRPSPIVFISLIFIFLLCYVENKNYKTIQVAAHLLLVHITVVGEDQILFLSEISRQTVFLLSQLITENEIYKKFPKSLPRHNTHSTPNSFGILFIIFFLNFKWVIFIFKNFKLHITNSI